MLGFGPAALAVVLLPVGLLQAPSRTQTKGPFLIYVIAFVIPVLVVLLRRPSRAQPRFAVQNLSMVRGVFGAAYAYVSLHYFNWASATINRAGGLGEIDIGTLLFFAVPVMIPMLFSLYTLFGSGALSPRDSDQ